MTAAGKRLRELAETATVDDVEEKLAEARRLAPQAEPEELFWIEALLSLKEAGGVVRERA